MDDQTHIQAAALLYNKLAQELLRHNMSNTIVGVTAVGVGVDLLKDTYSTEAVALWLEGFAFALRTGKQAPPMPADAARH